jgi:signal transduction histidine kinase
MSASPAVLVVDDKPANLTALEAVLAQPDLAVVRATSGRQALALVQAHDYAVVILDVQMPDMDGLEVARHIRAAELHHLTPVIFLTAFDIEPALVRQAYASGAVDFVVKPFDPQILRAKVSVFVELFRQRAEIAAQGERLREAQAAAQAAALAEARHQWEAAATRARIERERDEANAQKDELRRLDGLKDQFLATLSHELRNPLMSLLAAAEMLDRHPIEDMGLGRLHGLVRRQLAHLRRLVEDSLELSRFTQGKIEVRPHRIDLRETIERAVELTQATIDRRGIDLVVSLPPGPVRTLGDDVRLAQVISNLLDNAVKFSPEGGRVHLALEVSDSAARIMVRDSGAGIPADRLGQIFDPFVQGQPGDALRGGLGIGLALVKQLVELHGGRVAAASAGRGLGAELTVTLPLIAAEHDPALPPAADAPGPGRRETPTPAGPATGPARTGAPRPRVLVVDDNPEIRSAVQVFLQLEGHAVLAADCGRAALDQITRSDPDVVILDIGLPDLDGYAVARQVRAARSDHRPRLIAMTGNVGSRARDRALEAGFDAHLPKPIDGRTLLRVVAGG